MNINEQSVIILNISKMLYGVYKPHEYEKVILPMVVIKRFHDCLLHDNEYNFYNTSELTFEELLKNTLNIGDNFRKYIKGFSDNILDILNDFRFNEQIKVLEENDLLYLIIQEFDKLYLGDDKITSIDMGYIFEELIKQFTEKHNDHLGAHFTSRDIIYLMTDLLLAEDKETLTQESVVKSVYDMAMGTSQMLGCMEERLNKINNNIEINCYGQELNKYTCAIAKADMLIKGRNSENMKQGDTLSDDKFKNYTFDYIISNPPYGISWKKNQEIINKEHKLGDKGRFRVGLPSVNDSQMLFMLNGVKKLKDDGKMAILHNGSPLFTGDAGSGSSEIRRCIIENDWLDAIVQLSTDAFYNTPITTYIWIISKEKPYHRQGKVQVIV